MLMILNFLIFLEYKFVSILNCILKIDFTPLHEVIYFRKHSVLKKCFIN